MEDPRRRKGLERKLSFKKRVLNYVAGGLFGLVSCLGLSDSAEAKADKFLNYVKPDSVTVVATSADEFDRATINEDWIAWSSAGNITARNRESGLEYSIANSGTAIQPNLDSVGGKRLVYSDNGSIRLVNLETMASSTVASGSANEMGMNPKINGDSIVFKSIADYGFGTIASVIHYSIDEDMLSPIALELGDIGEPDVFGKYIVWPEFEDLLSDGGKYNTKVYDMELGKQFRLGHRFMGDVVAPAIYNDKIVSVANSMGWAGGPTSLILYNLAGCAGESNPSSRHVGMGMIHSSPGKKGEVSLYENLMVWTNLHRGGYIMGVDLNSRVSIDQFQISSVGDCHHPDAYVDSDGTMNVIYMSGNNPVVSQPSGMKAMSANQEKLNYLITAQIIPYPGPSKCGDKGTVHLPGDIDQDCYVGFSDLAIIAQNWMKEGLTNTHHKDGDYRNNDPNNVIEYCEVGPECDIGKRRMVNLDYSGDCKVGIEEVAMIARNWLSCSDPENARCDVYWKEEE